MSLSREDLRPERTIDVIETIEKLRGVQYADRLRFAVNISGLLAQCEAAAIDGSQLSAVITSSLAVAVCADQLPKVLGLERADVAAALKAHGGDKADIIAKIRQEMGK
jgi:hypothetical protein